MRPTKKPSHSNDTGGDGAFGRGAFKSFGRCSKCLDAKCAFHPRNAVLKKIRPIRIFYIEWGVFNFFGMLKNIVCIANVLFFTDLLQAFDGIVV